MPHFALCTMVISSGPSDQQVELTHDRGITQAGTSVCVLRTRTAPVQILTDDNRRCMDSLITIAIIKESMVGGSNRNTPIKYDGLHHRLTDGLVDRARLALGRVAVFGG